MCYLLYLLPVANNVLQIYTNVACGISTNGSDFLEANSVCSVTTSVQLNGQFDCFCTRSTIEATSLQLAWFCIHNTIRSTMGVRVRIMQKQLIECMLCSWTQQ